MFYNKFQTLAKVILAFIN